MMTVPYLFANKTHPVKLSKSTVGICLREKVTGKSFSETLILESVNSQYDERLFIEFPEKYKFTTCCVQILF